jgi:hypothetical protein
MPSPLVGSAAELVHCKRRSIAIAIGVLVSFGLYSTRVTPSVPRPLPSPSATDAFVYDRQVLLLEPLFAQADATKPIASGHCSA